jgi:hypothetical protein
VNITEEGIVMIRIREIDHLVLRVVNMKAMLKFYCEVWDAPLMNPLIFARL